jgi:hypothetical protein
VVMGPTGGLRWNVMASRLYVYVGRIVVQVRECCSKTLYSRRLKMAGSSKGFCRTPAPQQHLIATIDKTVVQWHGHGACETRRGCCPPRHLVGCMVSCSVSSFCFCQLALQPCLNLHPLDIQAPVHIQLRIVCSKQ